MAHSLNNKPHYLEIRERMKKDPDNYLWDKLKWNDEDLAFYNSGQSKPSEIKKADFSKRPVSKPFKKVMRMSDGFIYNSVNECIAGEPLGKKAIHKRLNEGIEYKRL